MVFGSMIPHSKHQKIDGDIIEEAMPGAKNPGR